MEPQQGQWQIKKATEDSLRRSLAKGGGQIVVLSCQRDEDFADQQE